MVWKMHSTLRRTTRPGAKCGSTRLPRNPRWRKGLEGSARKKRRERLMSDRTEGSRRNSRMRDIRNRRDAPVRGSKRKSEKWDGLSDRSRDWRGRERKGSVERRERWRERMRESRSRKEFKIARVAPDLLLFLKYCLKIVKVHNWS